MTTLCSHPTAQPSRWRSHRLVRSARAATVQLAHNWKHSRAKVTEIPNAALSQSRSESKFSHVRRAALCEAVFFCPSMSGRQGWGWWWGGGGGRCVRPNTIPYANSLRHSQHLLSSLRGSTDTNNFRPPPPPPPICQGTHAHCTFAILFLPQNTSVGKEVRKQQTDLRLINRKRDAVKRWILYCTSSPVKW